MDYLAGNVQLVIAIFALKNEVTIYSYSNHQWPNYK